MNYNISPLNKNTRYKVVKGIHQHGVKAYACKVCIRVTHDSKGKTLSLEDGEYMLMIPLEGVTDLIDTTF